MIGYDSLLMSSEIGRVIVSFIVKVFGTSCSFAMLNWPVDLRCVGEYSSGTWPMI